MQSIKGLVAAAIFIAIIIVGGIFFYAKSNTSTSSVTPTPVQSAQTKTPTSTQATINLTGSGFSPSMLTIKVGTKVIWINNSGENAQVDSNPHPIHSSFPPMNFDAFSNGSSVSLVFDKAGTYGYHNHLNPSQTGTIVVQ